MRAFLIAALFKLLPDVPVTWRDVLPGALVAALMLSWVRYGIAAFSEGFWLHERSGYRCCRCAAGD